MCGVFGFMGLSEADRPDLGHLCNIAIDTERRGSHSHGFAWIDQGSRIHSYKSPGAMTDNLEVLMWLEDARTVIGHCRYATNGSYDDNINNHPHPADSGWIVHNGTVLNDEDLIVEHDLLVQSECDTEVIGRLIETLGGSLMDRVQGTTDLLDGPQVVLGLWTRPDRLVVVRRGKPLFIERRPEGFYFCSVPYSMKKPKRFRQHTARVLGRETDKKKNRVIWQRVREVTPSRFVEREYHPNKKGTKKCQSKQRQLRVSSFDTVTRTEKELWSRERGFSYEENEDGTGSWVLR